MALFWAWFCEVRRERVEQVQLHFSQLCNLFHNCCNDQSKLETVVQICRSSCTEFVHTLQVVLHTINQYNFVQ